METHQPGKHHADKHGDESQGVILLADHFVIEAENIIPKETLRRCVNMSLGLQGCIFQGFTSSTRTAKLFPLAHNKKDVLLLGNFLLHPLIEIFLRQNVEIGLHVVVAKAAQLGAKNFEASGLRGSEMKGEIQAGDEILLDAKFANVEGMADVF